MNRALLTILLTFAGIYFAKAHSAVEERYLGSWMFMEVHHDIANRAYLTVYMENDVYQFRSLNCRYARFSAGYNFLPWLKTGVNYVPVSEPDRWRHYLEGDLMGILKSGDFKVSLRERYRYRLTGEGTHELRSRLKLAYDIPESKLSPYIAIELFTWATGGKRPVTIWHVPAISPTICSWSGTISIIPSTVCRLNISLAWDSISSCDRQELLSAIQVVLR